MAKHYVNLDGLILREDFEVSSDNPSPPGGPVSNFTISQLEHGQNLFGVLRKPDFQRETSNWTKEQVVELVKNFLDEELIPALILWKAPNKNIFVIDGAHRLSALIAWVNDDYGDRKLSKDFFGHGPDDIPKAQLEIGEETRQLIAKEVGAYAYLRTFIQKPDAADPVDLKRARNIASVQIVTQTVTSDANHAEQSFYRINQGGAVIDDMETEIIHARTYPEALAARALLRAGTGHRYWGKFSDPVRDQIESLAKQSYDLLYKPELTDQFRTLDLPMAGRGYDGKSLGVLFELIHLCNNLTRDNKKKGRQARQTLKPKQKDDPRRDTDGSKTIAYLENVKEIAELLNSDERKSLGFHPAVYCYSATGQFQPTAFFAEVELVKHLRHTNGFFEFTKHRKDFEEFLVKYKYFVNQMIGGYGAMTRSLPSLVNLYNKILLGLKQGNTQDQIKANILAEPEFRHLKELPTKPAVVAEAEHGTSSPAATKRRRKFSQETKAAARLRSALESAERCPICGARRHPSGDTVDHIKDRKFGGSSDHSDNAQLTHPYCNTGYKERLIHLERQKAQNPGAAH